MQTIINTYITICRMWKAKTIFKFKMQLNNVRYCHLNYYDLCSSFKYIAGRCCSYNTPDSPDKSNSINIKLSIVSLSMMNLCNCIPINKIYPLKIFKPKMSFWSNSPLLAQRNIPSAINTCNQQCDERKNKNENRRVKRILRYISIFI